MKRLINGEIEMDICSLTVSSEASSVTRPMKKPIMAKRPLKSSACGVKLLGSWNPKACLTTRSDAIQPKLLFYLSVMAIHTCSGSDLDRAADTEGEKEE